MTPSPQHHPRFDRLDALRGLAMVWMVLFHFCFDLNHLGGYIARQDFYRDPFWTTQRSVIVSLFLLCAGLGQALAWQAGVAWPQFWRRSAQVLGCALLVSLGSAWMFPASWISFGVLHGMVLMLLATRLLAPMGVWLWPLGALALALPRFATHVFFDTRWTNWVGLITQKPITEDYVPVLPWLGVMLWGLAAGQWLLAHQPALLTGAVPAPLRPLARLGRWPLSVYMVHQPLLIGALTALAALRH